MSLAVYEISIPVFVRMLGNCAVMLGKAEAQATAQGMEETTLLRARLHPDMFPLARQIRIAADGARGAAPRLAGMELADPEVAEFAVFDRGFDRDFPADAGTFAELRLYLQEAVAFVRSVPPEALDGAATRTFEVTRRGSTRRFTGLPFLVSYVLPNFYFHLATAYGLLRHHGIDIGKSDFEGPPAYDVIASPDDRRLSA